MLVLDGVEWTVEHAEPQVGKVSLVAADGERMRISRCRCRLVHPITSTSVIFERTPAG